MIRTKLYFAITLLISLLVLVSTGFATSPEGMLDVHTNSTTNSYTEDFTSYNYKAHSDNTIWNIWHGQVHMGLRDAVDQSQPAVTSDNEGNLLLVWQDWRNGNSDIYARKLDNNGNKLWAQDVRINSDSGTASQSYPAIASDSGGNLLIVWTDRRNGHSDVYVQKVDGFGNKLWQSDVRVTSDIGTALQGYSSIATDNNGDLLLVWEDNRNGNQDIYAQKLDGSGNKSWDQDVRVNSDSGLARQSSPAIATDNNGDLLLVWEDNRNGNQDIYAQKLDENGNKLWPADVYVSSGLYPAVTSGNGGNMLLAWTIGSDGIYAQKLDGNGNKLWVQDLRVNVHYGGIDFSIASDSNYNLLVVWETTVAIYAQKIDSDGNRLWAQDVLVNDDAGYTHRRVPVITSDIHDNLILAWTDYRNPIVSI